jgi:GTP cyclohydrolase-4
MHTIHIGVGSNLGDRQGNILQALQRIRAFANVEAVSAYYEMAAIAAPGPAFLNVAARVSSALDPRAFEAAVRAAELAVGRQRAQYLAARAIDVDILFYGDVTGEFGNFTVPHPYLPSRPFNVLPLAEIAPDLVDPASGKTMAALAAGFDAATYARKVRSLNFLANRQEGEPDVKLSIARAGVSSVRRVVRLQIGGRETAFNAEFSMVADLAPDKAGVHMSRFSELLEEALLEVLSRNEGHGRVEDVATAVAREIVDSQKASRADVRLRAEFGLERWTPVSGKRGEESYTLVTIAHAERGGELRRVVGVEAEGMTACPCAQLMIREHSLVELREAGFTEDQATRALDALPVATHNQRGRGSILIGTGDPSDSAIDAADLVEIVENAMSSETYDLLKRPDEFFIVNKAHRNPKFVEDVVRGILGRSLEVYRDFGDDAFVFASQVNYESIHKHDAFAEAFGTFGELRGELRSGFSAPHKTDLAGWLGSARLALT